MSDEQIIVYRRDAPDTPLQAGRAEYYDHTLDTYSDQFPCVVDLLLFNKHHEVLLQKRARNKRFNPGKLHTTVGGHINVGETPDFAMVNECMEELGAALLLFSKDELPAAFTKLGAYTDRAAIGYFADNRFRDYRTEPEYAGSQIKDRSYFYLGRYDGSFGSPDRDSAGYEWMRLTTFDEELRLRPEQFTTGLPIFIQSYRTEIEDFIKRY